jgi:hypothetical protein
MKRSDSRERSYGSIAFLAFAALKPGYGEGTAM